MLANGIVNHGLNHREGHAFAAEIIQRVLDELAPDAAATRRLVYGEIRDPSFVRLPVEARADIAEYSPRCLRHKDAIRIGGNVLIHVPRLAPTPIVRAHNAKAPLHILVNGDTFETFDRDALQFIDIAGLIESYFHIYGRDTRVAVPSFLGNNLGHVRSAVTARLR